MFALVDDRGAWREQPPKLETFTANKLPVTMQADRTRFSERGRSVYIPNESPNSALKTVATVGLYLVVVAFILLLGRLLRAGLASELVAPIST